MGHQIEKDLEAIGVEVSELKEKMVSSTWFDNAVQIGRLEFSLPLPLGFDAFSRNPAATQSLESNSSFITPEKANLTTPPQQGDGEVAQHR